MRDDRRRCVGARGTGRSSHWDGDPGCARCHFASACRDRSLSRSSASKTATAGTPTHRHRALCGARHLSFDPPSETLTLHVADRCLHAKRVRAVHARIANRRKDFLHKCSTGLVRSGYRAIFVGNVNACALARSGHGKSVLDLPGGLSAASEGTEPPSRGATCGSGIEPPSEMVGSFRLRAGKTDSARRAGSLQRLSGRSAEIQVDFSVGGRAAPGPQRISVASPGRVGVRRFALFLWCGFESA